MRVELLEERWHHVAVVFKTADGSPTQARLFLDGRAHPWMNLRPPPLVAEGQPRLWIGDRPSTAAWHRSWPGLIHQVRLSTRVLYRDDSFAPPPRMATDEGTTVALWSFDSCEDGVQEDSGIVELLGNLSDPARVECVSECPDPSGN